MNTELCKQASPTALPCFRKTATETSTRNPNQLLGFASLGSQIPDNSPGIHARVASLLVIRFTPPAPLMGAQKSASLALGLVTEHPPWLQGPLLFLLLFLRALRDPTALQPWNRGRSVTRAPW